MTNADAANILHKLNVATAIANAIKALRAANLLRSANALANDDGALWSTWQALQDTLTPHADAKTLEAVRLLGIAWNAREGRAVQA